MLRITPKTFEPRGKRITQTEKKALASLGCRWCAACRSVKPMDAFGIDKSRADGLYPRCRDCASAKSRHHHNESPERHNAARRERYYANHGAELERQRKRYHANRPAILARKRELHAELHGTKSRLVRLLRYFADRPGYFDRLVEEIVWSSAGESLQYMSREIEEACARHVGDV